MEYVMRSGPARLSPWECVCQYWLRHRGSEAGFALVWRRGGSIEGSVAFLLLGSSVRSLGCA